MFLSSFALKIKAKAKAKKKKIIKKTFEASYVMKLEKYRCRVLKLLV